MIKSVHSNSVQPNVENNKKIKTRNKGIIRANMAQGLMAFPATAASVGVIAGMRKAAKVGYEDNISIKKAVSETLTNTGLRDAGVKVSFVNQPKKLPKSINGFVDLFKNIIDNPSKSDLKVMETISNELKADFDKNKLKKAYFEKLLKIDSDSLFAGELSKKIKSLPYFIQFKLGINAAFLPNVNQIVVPDKALSVSAFHEMGHAMNANFSKVGKFLQQNRKIAMIAAPAIALVAICTKKKVSEPKSEKKIQQAKDFVKRNAGKLSFLAFAPVLIEEAMASLKGNKMAKMVLSPELLKKVKMTNALGFSSYLLAAATTGLTTMLAVKIKDNIQEKHEQKRLLKAQKNS